MTTQAAVRYTNSPAIRNCYREGTTAHKLRGPTEVTITLSRAEPLSDELYAAIHRSLLPKIARMLRRRGWMHRPRKTVV